MQTSDTPSSTRGQRAIRYALALLNLHRDQAAPEVIDAAIRSGARIGGTNAWVLVAAIAIASVGLNVNSTAVIIGAMLISPLMGPIIGIGYGLGVHDSALIRRSLGVLATFTVISLAASTLYFLASPLKLAHSELLARTSPTIWDVLIAFFGGAAGMIGLTRQEKTTLIPGVAIATALMPPLCAAGYGLATWQPAFFGGALYLFAINCVFIGLATLVVTRILRLPKLALPDVAAQLRARTLVVLAVSATLVPSVFLAYRLVEQELFSTRAEAFVQAQVRGLKDVVLLGREIDAARRTISVTVLGTGVTPALEQRLTAQLRERVDGGSIRVVHPSEVVAPPANTLNADLMAQAAATQAAVVAALDNASRIAQLEREAAQQRDRDTDRDRLQAEVMAQLPTARRVLVSWIPSGESGGLADTVHVSIDTPRRLPAAELARLKRWLAVRIPGVSVDVLVGRSSA